jgi:hypothetical protein
LSLRTVVVRILRALHAALGRWLAQVDPLTPKGKPRARKSPRKRGNQHTPDSNERKRYTFFDLPPDAFRSMRDPDEEEADAWYRAHFRINGRPLP